MLRWSIECNSRDCDELLFMRVWCRLALLFYQNAFISRTSPIEGTVRSLFFILVLSNYSLIGFQKHGTVQINVIDHHTWTLLLYLFVLASSKERMWFICNRLLWLINGICLKMLRGIHTRGFESLNNYWAYFIWFKLIRILQFVVVLIKNKISSGMCGI